jgi:hypothetical protein
MSEVLREHDRREYAIPAVLDRIEAEAIALARKLDDRGLSRSAFDALSIVDDVAAIRRAIGGQR